jgi:hypothetical protein
MNHIRFGILMKVEHKLAKMDKAKY